MQPRSRRTVASFKQRGSLKLRPFVVLPLGVPITKACKPQAHGPDGQAWK